MLLVAQFTESPNSSYSNGYKVLKCTVRRSPSMGAAAPVAIHPSSDAAGTAAGGKFGNEV